MVMEKADSSRQNQALLMTILKSTTNRALNHNPNGSKGGCVVPEGTQIYFPQYPALRLRLRAGLNWAAPTALDFQPASSTRKIPSLLLTHTLTSCA